MARRNEVCADLGMVVKGIASGILMKPNGPLELRDYL
jgi:hypothetical protein